MRSIRARQFNPLTKRTHQLMTHSFRPTRSHHHLLMAAQTRAAAGTAGNSSGSSSCSSSVLLAAGLGVGVGLGLGVLATLWWKRGRLARALHSQSTGKPTEITAARVAAPRLQEVGTPLRLVYPVGEEQVVDSATRWIKLYKAQFKMEGSDKLITWEYVKRTTRVGEIDGVDVIATLVTPGQPDRLIVINNYRMPVRAGCIEFPAGLSDGGEPAEQTAIRELLEETGYVGTVTAVSPIAHIDPYKSTENVRMVFMRVDGTLPDNLNPTPHREPDENIQVLLVPVDGLLDALLQLQKSGYLLEGKLLAYALALQPK